MAKCIDRRSLITEGKGKLAANYSAWIKALKTKENGVEHHFYGSREFVLRMQHQAIVGAFEALSKKSIMRREKS